MSYARSIWVTITPVATGAQWDGLGDNGEALPAGTYTFEVNATSSDGDAVNATSFVEAQGRSHNR